MRVDSAVESTRSAKSIVRRRISPLITGCGEQILGVGIAAVDGEYLPGERVGRLPVATVDRSNRAIEQFVDRRL